MDLRFIERDGKRILQQAGPAVGVNPDGTPIYSYEDIPLFTEPKKAREFYIEFDAGPTATMRAWETKETIFGLGAVVTYDGRTPDQSKIIHVREILP